jgi:hypothetical protein
MHGVLRMYSGHGPKKLFDLLEECKNEVEGLIRQWRGS